MRRRALAGAALTAVVLMSSVAGCSQSRQNPEHGTASVVASTPVWASVAAAVAGNRATVTSLASGAVHDPRSFTPGPDAATRVADASLVVYNGGEYDHWIEGILKGSPDIPRIDAHSLAPAQPPANEYVFYDLPTAAAVADGIADSLGQSDAEHAADYTNAAQQFGEELDTLSLAQHGIGQAHPGASVVATDSVASFAFRNAGIADRTPPGFAMAVAQGTPPSAADTAAVLDLIRSRRVSFLVVGDQRKSPVTDQVSGAARTVGLPVISVSEGLPDGMTYLQWQRKTVDEIAAALDTAPPAHR